MCSLSDGKMTDFRFGLDAKREETAFGQGSHKVKFWLGFSPEAYDKGLSGLFFYYDKHNGDPLRLVESYDLMKGQRTAVCKGMVGLVIIRPCQKACNDCITLDNGKQKFAGKETLDKLKRVI